MYNTFLKIAAILGTIWDEYVSLVQMFPKTFAAISLITVTGCTLSLLF